MADQCGNTRKNPISPCGESDGMIKKVYFIKAGETFTDQADAKLLASHQTKIQNGNEIPFPPHLTLEDRSSGVVNEQTALGIKNVSQGTVEHALAIAANTDLYKRIETFKGSNEEFDVFYQTDTGKLIMRKNSDGTYGGFEMDFNNVENPNLNDGSVTAKATVHLSIDPVQWREQAVSFKPDFSTLKLKALTDLIITIVTQGATEITFTVKRTSDNEDIQNANPIYNLAEGDFDLLDGTGSAQTIDTFTTGTVSTSGVYTLAGTAFVSGTLDLKDSSLMATSGYDSSGAATVTI